MFSPGAISSHRSSALNCSSWHAWNCAKGELEPSSLASDTHSTQATQVQTHKPVKTPITTPYTCFSSSNTAAYRALVWQFPWPADPGGTRRSRASAAAGSTARRCTAAQTTLRQKCPAFFATDASAIMQQMRTAIAKDTVPLGCGSNLRSIGTCEQ